MFASIQVQVNSLEKAVLVAASAGVGADDALCLEILSELQHLDPLQRCLWRARQWRRLVEVEEHPRLARAAEAFEGLPKLLFGARLTRALAAEPRRHDPEIDVAERRLLINDGLRRRPDARDNVVLPLERSEVEAGPIAFGSDNTLDDLVEDLTLLGTVTGRRDEDADAAHGQAWVTRTAGYLGDAAATGAPQVAGGRLRLHDHITNMELDLGNRTRLQRPAEPYRLVLHIAAACRGAVHVDLPGTEIDDPHFGNT